MTGEEARTSFFPGRQPAAGQAAGDRRLRRL